MKHDPNSTTASTDFTTTIDTIQTLGDRRRRGTVTHRNRSQGSGGTRLHTIADLQEKIPEVGNTYYLQDETALSPFGDILQVKQVANGPGLGVIHQGETVWKHTSGEFQQWAERSHLSVERLPVVEATGDEIVIVDPEQATANTMLLETLRDHREGRRNGTTTDANCYAASATEDPTRYIVNEFD